MLIPNRTSMKQLNDLLIGFFLADAHQKPVATLDASERSGVRYDLATRQIKFLCNAGFLAKEGGNYRLTQDAARYAQLLDWKKVNEAQEPLARIMGENEFAERVIHYVRVAGPVSKEDVINRVGVISKSRNTSGHRRGAEAFTDLLIFSGLLRDTEGQITIGNDRDRPPTDIPIEIKVPVRNQETPKETRITLSVVLNLDSQLEPEKLRELIAVVKEELLESSESDWVDSE